MTRYRAYDRQIAHIDLFSQCLRLVSNFTEKQPYSPIGHTGGPERRG